MKLGLNQHQNLLRDAFAEMLAVESSPARVRAAEPTGFDPALWSALAQMGAIGTRVPTAAGGTGAGLTDALVIAEQIGRWLAPAPLIEAMVTARLLATAGTAPARAALECLLEGEKIGVVALRPSSGDDEQWVPGGAAAQQVVGIHEGALVLVEQDAPQPSANLGAAPLSRCALDVGQTVLLRDYRGQHAHEAAVEEWKLLTAAALLGLARRALEIGATYATERIQFNRPIGTFQGVAHPLADAVTAVDGGRHLVQYTAWALSRRRHDAAALVSMAYVWSAEAATNAVARALHAHGGYGLSLEYDIQLYHRRAKAWALAAGDPEEELLRAFARREGKAPCSLPDPGETDVDFSLGQDAEEFRVRARAAIEPLFTPELRNRSRLGWEACDFEFQNALARTGFLFPNWPEEFGGQGCSPLEARALTAEMERFGWPPQPFATTRIVGETLMHFGSDDLKEEVLPRIAKGDAICCLGYTEPSSGSDVAAAATRAVREGDDWIINGQKTFTSGANIGQYILLLTRTDLDAAKHRGLTMFLLPSETAGIEIQPIHTLSDERTNATYYDNVRIPDRYRIGEVNGGWDVMGYALNLEHGGGGMTGFLHMHEQLLEAALAWARTRKHGKLPEEDPRVQVRLARVAMHCEVVRALGLASLWAGMGNDGLPGIGPMVKLFGAETFIGDASALLDLAAPDSLLAADAAGNIEGGAIEYGYRLSTATSIYGGTSEIMRSIIAQAALGMPRSRS